MQTTMVEIYGDSIMRGTLFDSGSQRYRFTASKLIKTIQDQFHIDICNHSKFGCTVEKGNVILDSALEQGGCREFAVLEYGGNDCDYDWAQVALCPDEKHDPFTPLERFEAVYEQMVAKLKANNVTPVLMTLPPLDAEKYFKWITRNGLNAQNILKFLGDVQAIYRTQELYSQAVTKLAYKTNSLLIDVRSMFLQRRDCKDMMCIDGIHPNENGYNLICDAFVHFIKNLR